jgi:histidine triad (HIT) family protein
MATDCLFCKIIKKDIPSNVVYEDKDVFAFLDINPVNPGHTLIVPKKHSGDLTEMDSKAIATLYSAVQKLSSALLKTGYDGVNVMMNIKPAAGQIIFHSHVHVIPRQRADGLHPWPGKPYAPGDAKAWAERLAKALKTK